MHHTRREKYSSMSLSILKKLRDDLQTVIEEVENNPVPREIDIGTGYTGAPELIAEELTTLGDKKTDKWSQIQTIYCSRQKCSKCPHGPFMFRYRRFKNGRLKVDYQGKPVFDTRKLLKMRERCSDPVAIGNIVTGSIVESNRNQQETEKRKEGKMGNPLEHYENYDAFTEVYEVVKTVELVGKDGNTYRIEVLKCFSNPNTLFTTRCWIGEYATVQPTYPQSYDKFDREPESMRIWTYCTNFPWTSRDSVEEVLSQALGFLSDRAKHSKE